MTLKIALFVLLAVAIAQAVPIEKRDAPESTTAANISKEMEDAMNVLKSKLEQTLKNVQDNDLFQQLQEKFQKFGEEFATQSKQIVNKIQQDASKL